MTKKKNAPSNAGSVSTGDSDTPVSETKSAPEAKPKVGFRSPPVATRWKPGQSGNPAGKPKGAKNLATVIKAEAESKVVIKDAAGNTKKITKLEAIVKTVVMKALKGDAKAISIMLAQIKEHMTPDIENDTVPDPTAEDLQVLKDHAKVLELLEQAESK